MLQILPINSQVKGFSRLSYKWSTTRAWLIDLMVAAQLWVSSSLLQVIYSELLNTQVLSLVISLLYTSLPTREVHEIDKIN